MTRPSSRDVGIKGIVLAGGAGTRLAPLTSVISKQLLPVYDKPMVYYPLSTLMLAGIRDFLLITTGVDAQRFRALLGDGGQWGIRIRYAIQDIPRGIPEAFIIGREFIGGEPVALILGDNIHYGHGLGAVLNEALQKNEGATIFCAPVSDPGRYGIADVNAEGRLVRVVEKPAAPASNIAVTGLYVFDGSVCERAEKIEPSKRGELEIVDVINGYAAEGKVSMVRLGRGMAWLDMGTPQALLDACNFVAAVEARQGLKIGCPEEVAFRLGYIDADALLDLARASGGAYGAYLRSVANEYGSGSAA